jgi:translation initiation factor 3 subunit C
LEILENTKEIVVIENAEEWEDDDKLPPIEAGSIFRIPGSVVSFVERLDDELTRSLQHIDPHTAEYVERLTDEALLYAQLVRALIYVESLKKNPSLELPQESLNRVVMRRLEHVYFKVRYIFITSQLPLTLSALASGHHHGGQQLESRSRHPRL